MTNVRKISSKINATYNTNAFIYNLKKTPIIKNLLPAQIYGDENFKKLAKILMDIFGVLVFIVGKFLYIGIMIFTPALMYFENKESFITMFVFLTIIGAFYMDSLMRPNTRKYYAVTLLKIDAKQYAVSSYMTYLIRSIVMSAIFLAWLGTWIGLDILTIALLTFLVPLMKVIASALMLRVFDKKERTIQGKSGFIYPIILAGLILGYGLPLAKIYINSFGVICICAALIIPAVISFMYITKSDVYGRLYKKTVTLNNVIFKLQDASASQTQKQFGSILNNSKVDEKIEKKKGYDYFNSIFVLRHKKILTSSARKLAIAYVIAVAALILAMYIKVLPADLVNQTIMTRLPMMLFIMYFSSKGNVITQAMFVNCDHSMLTYKFYRDPKVILNLFIIRLKTSIKINLLPASVLAVGVPLLLYTSGGTQNPLTYLEIFLTVLTLSVLFSVHTMFIYYILQPYNAEMRQKGFMYMLVNMVVCFVCYFSVQIQAPAFIFCLGIIAFTVIYTTLALIITYKKAPKTFKLK